MSCTLLPWSGLSFPMVRSDDGRSSASSTDGRDDFLKKEKEVASLPATFESSESPSTQDGDEETNTANSQMDKSFSDEKKENDDDAEEEEEKPITPPFSKPESQLQNEAVAPREWNDKNPSHKSSFVSSIVDFVRGRLTTTSIEGIANVVQDSAVGAFEDHESVSSDADTGDDTAARDYAATDRSIGHGVSALNHETKHDKEDEIEDENGEELEDDDKAVAHRAEKEVDAVTVFEDTFAWLQRLLKDSEKGDQSPPNDAIKADIVENNDLHISTVNDRGGDSSLTPKVTQSSNSVGRDFNGVNGGVVSEADSMSVKVESSVSSKASIKEPEKKSRVPSTQKPKSFKPFKAIKKIMDTFTHNTPKK